jgi:hypothetical protein
VEQAARRAAPAGRSPHLRQHLVVLIQRGALALNDDGNGHSSPLGRGARLFQLEKKGVNLGWSDALGGVFLRVTPHNAACLELNFLAFPRRSAER